MNDFNCFNIHYCSFLCEKILTFYVCSFLAYCKTGSCCNLEILWRQNSNVPLPLKKMEKEEFGMELLLKEYVKIKDPNELISKDNLTDK